MARILYSNRDIIYNNDPTMVIKNATVTEINQDTLHLSGEHIEIKRVDEGTEFYNFLLMLEAGARAKIIEKNNHFFTNQIPKNKPKILSYVYVVKRGIFTSLIKFLIESLSFELIKFPPSFTKVPKMLGGYYPTGFTKPVDIQITGKEYDNITFLENAKITIKNIIE